MYEGVSGSIILDGYESDAYHSWRINSECESLLLESTIFNIEMKYDVLDLVEEGSLLRNLSGFGNFVQKTNTGTLTLNFASDSSTEEDGFEIDWQCAERTLSSWDSWSESCSVTCGTGQQTRSRQCSAGVGECEGAETDVRDCDKEQCGKLNAFSKLFCT